MEAAKRIEEILLQKGMSKKDLADAMNILPQGVQTMLKGNPTEQRILQIAKALGVPVGDLYDFPQFDYKNSKMAIEIDGVSYTVKKNMTLQNVIVIDGKNHPIQDKISIGNITEIAGKEYSLKKEIEVRNIVMIDGIKYPVKKKFSIHISEIENPD